MANVGDRVQIASSKIGREPRVGVVTVVRGNMLTVRWESGEESTLVPASGSLTVMGRGAGRSGARTSGAKKGAAKAPKKGATAKKAPAKKASIKKASIKKAATKQAAAKKAGAKKAGAKKSGPAKKRSR